MSNSKVIGEYKKIHKDRHTLFPIKGGNVELYAHSIPKTEDDVVSLWHLIKSTGISKVIAL